ncbi:unnamed protein product [Prorocentrum cordatum]|uniref:Uncharacterized protein n=1 Tax=Prorocentrum cordatum TaxID=2364126 RepID=A0ABN9STP2_9DINO|nr:unnamed protein product [Polarella glacialis]
MTPNADAMPERIKLWYASAAGAGASFEAKVFCGMPTPADRYRPTSSQVEGERYQAALASMGVTSVSETVTVIRVGGTQGPSACVAGQTPDLWGDANFLRTVVQNSVSAPAPAPTYQQGAPAQQQSAPSPGQQWQRPVSPAAPPPDLGPPPTPPPPPAPQRAAAPAAPAPAPAPPPAADLEVELPAELPVREGTLPGFQDGFFPGHFSSVGPGWEARARLLEGIRLVRAKRTAARELA